MVKRLLTSVIGIIIFFAVVLSHRFVLYAAVVAVVLGMLYEVYGVMGVGRFLRGIGYLSAVIICAGYAKSKFVASVMLVIVMFMLSMILMHGKVTSKKVMSVAFITLAISLLMSSILLIRKYCDKYTIILPFVCAWMTDTGAYTIGSLFGKHKLTPEISPNKTVEGAIGGLLFSIIGCIAYVYILVFVMTSKVPAPSVVLKFAVLGLFASVISQLGDLCASCIKRDYNKKDYGKILPGHGGLLDRFDSVLFAAPFVFYAMVYFIL